MKKRVAIDLVPIRVGEGGTGSGIWTYARELIRHMDQIDVQGLDVICLVNQGQIPFLSGLQNIRPITFPGFGKNILLRLLWIHLVLPLVCLFRRIDVLHKVATETPLFCPARRVTTVHDFYYEFLLENHPPESIRFYERLENFYFSLITRTCFRKSRVIVAVSEATQHEAIRRYPASAVRIHVIHHGAPDIRGQRAEDGGRKLDDGSQRTENFSLSTNNHQLTTNIERKAFNILCVAKFMEHKGQHLLIDAFEALLEQNPEWVDSVRLELRGFHNDADYCTMIKQRISASRYGKSMTMVGFNPNGCLTEIYRNADLVVLLSSYEGFGLPLLEAQGMGVPVLCSNLPVLREVGGEGATYVDRDDRNAVVHAMREFIKNSELGETMRIQAIENLKRFSWNKAAEQTMDVYKAS